MFPYLLVAGTDLWSYKRSPTHPLGGWGPGPLMVGLGSKDAATRFAGRERSMSRSHHRAGSVGAGCSASGVAIAAARWVWLAFELSDEE